MDDQQLGRSHSLKPSSGVLSKNEECIGLGLWGKMRAPGIGEFIELRARPWLVEAVDSLTDRCSIISLSCIADDAQGERLDVVWDAELAPTLSEGDAWSDIAHGGVDEVRTFAGFLKTISWSTATAADKDLFQAPFRAGIRLDPYQLLPLRKALQLPRVNLLIGDDVGLGKTVEAGLVLRELLLRRRAQFVLVAAPPSMTLQWKEELETKFGLSFTIIDRERLAELRKQQGFAVNPWSTGSQFIISHRLLTDETYASGLRNRLHEFLPRGLLILDEAHHAAPASGARYAIDSQFTKAIRDLAGRFEHRLFLSATPHNGHSNSFSALLEMLDPQRFTRGVEVRPADLQPIMVRRLKADLRKLGVRFAERIIDPIRIEGLPDTTPELALAGLLAAYCDLRETRIRQLAPRELAQARIVMVGLQQRLLSSIPAFARTLRAHKKSLEAKIEKQADTDASECVARQLTTSFVEDEEATVALGATVDNDEAVEAATALGVQGASIAQLKKELEAVDVMLRLAQANATKPDVKVARLVAWIRSNMLAGKAWNARRVIIFTEWEDTRIWLERQLREALDDTNQVDERIGVYSGITGQDRREEIKRQFNADPDDELLRILICTDAAREGINLQTRCYDLFHFDLPWNPSRLEQRNGRIDRKLQPASQVFCRYFDYVQRPEDIVLRALVDKTETIRQELGAIGQVIESRISDELLSKGISRAEAEKLASFIKGADNDAFVKRAKAEMDDEEQARHARLEKENVDLNAALERSRKRVGVDSVELEQVLATALERAGVALDQCSADNVGRVVPYQLDPQHPAFARDKSWGDAFDDLRTRRRRRTEGYKSWRDTTPVRRIAFEPPIMENDCDAPDVIQVHLEHRLVRRLLSRFLSQGFQSSLNRACVMPANVTRPRLVLLGRLSLYGPGAIRLHEEILSVTAEWSDKDREKRPLRPFQEAGEQTTLEQLNAALRDARSASPDVVARLTALSAADIRDLAPEIERRAASAEKEAREDLKLRGDKEAESLRKLIEQQRERLRKADQKFDADQLEMNLKDEDLRQREADRQHWRRRLDRIEKELVEEPQRIRDSYEVKAQRLEPVGLVYLWPSVG